MNKVKLRKMRHVRYAAVLAAVLLLAAAAAGCAGKKTEAEESALAVVSGADSSEAEKDGSAGTALAEEKMSESKETEELPVTTLPAKPEGRPVKGIAVQMMSGVVKDAGMSTVTVQSEEYPDGITFLKEDAATGFAGGLLNGGEITVFYSGTIEGSDTTKVSVELLRDKREGDEERQAAMVSGKVLGVGMSAILIQTEDGRELGFEQDPRQVNATEGPTEEENVTILYSFPKEKQNEGELAPELIRKKN